MQLQFDDSAEAFRKELVTWLEANVPGPEVTGERPRSTAHLPQWARDWQRTMFDAGWLVPGNPPEFGGRNATLIEQFVAREEMSRRQITTSFNIQGLDIIVPSILGFGTPEQKERWAKPILRGEITAALGMSEPGAGSDLAGLRTRAELRGDHFVLNGQKVWTSGAHDADVILTFVRTDPEAPKHKGLSVLLVPTDTPGVERRPFGSICGPDDLDFNEVFFTDAHIPADNLVGPLHGGWTVANGSLGHERAMLWLQYSTSLLVFLERFTEEVRERHADDTRAVAELARVAIDAQAMRLLGMRTLAKTQRGTSSTEQSILKLFGSEALQRGNELAVEWAGAEALDASRRSHDTPLDFDAYNGGWFDQFLRSFALTIAGGTSEIQRNIVSQHVLGLPR